jgi:hypothetical protein
VQQLLDWLVQGAIGPAVVALPINWAASVWADAARRWFERTRRTDALSLLVMSAVEGAEPLSRAEFRAIRQLLERVETWDVAGHGTPEDLMDLIAGQLPERSAQERSALSRAIAAAVLDFAVHELEPELYNEAQGARLARVAANEASSLDRALVILAGLTGSMAEALDRLPPGPAGIAEVTAYLNGLVEWLDTDPWPQDDGFGGWPALVPSQIERKLEISTERAGQVPGQQVLDADELIDQCRRLVILGGPGSGKTWLVKRAARRCARGALARLASGAALDEVELPLLTTCQDLLGTARRATSASTVAWSALSRIPGVGGVRVITSLQVLFETRQGPTAIVLDSLDEGQGAEVLIRELVTESPAWRIIVTSRPSTWNQWQPIPDNDPARVKGTLRPLRYPDDVEPFISQWLASDPAARDGLIAQLRRRPPLREAATVPLILAFYCVLGGDQELPEHRTDLYPLVIDCLLTGRWRGRHDHQDFDPEACLRLLREWAWSACSDGNSGIRAWRDRFSMEPVPSPGDSRALDHVAVAIGRGVPEDEPTTPRSIHRMTRRFVHRTIQEHLVAEYVAALPADQAEEALFSHLWYDPDWEYAAPAGLILHPRRDEVLAHLMHRLTGGDFPGSFTAFDGCREIRRFLARVARESTEADWSPQATSVINLARLELISSSDLELIPASRWLASSGPLVNALLDRLEAEADHAQISDPDATIRTLTRVGITHAQRDRFRALLGKRLAKTEDVTLLFTFSYWAAVFTALEPSAEERAKVRGLLLDRLATGPYLDLMAVNGMTTLQGLAPTLDERTQLSRQLISLLPTVGHDHTDQVVNALLQLDPDDGQKHQVREILLADLPIRTLSGVERAWKSVAKLDPRSTDRKRLVAMLLDIISGRGMRHRHSEVAKLLAWLEATAEEREQAHAALLTAARREASTKVIFDEIGLAHEVAELSAADDPLRLQVRGALVSRIAASHSSFSARQLAEGLLLLQRSAAETRQLLTRVARALSAETDPKRVHMLAEAGITLCTAESGAGEAARQEWFRGQALEASLRRCEHWFHDTQEAPATPQQDVELAELPDALRRLAVTPEERARAHRAVLAMFSHLDGHNPRVLTFAAALTELAATADGQASTRRALTRALASGTESWAVQVIMDSLFQLGITDSEQGELKAVLIRTFARMPYESEAESVAREIIRLNPTLDDLHGSADWPCKPTDGLLAAVRRNTSFPAWLAALPGIIVD